MGITFSEEANWNKHVENLCVLRKLKYKLNRQNLEKLYLIYIRPIFEYACEVWDNCGVSNSCKFGETTVGGSKNYYRTSNLYQHRISI